MTPPRKPQPMDLASVAGLRTAIRHRVQHSRDNRFLYRLFCVLLLAEGHGAQAVADWMGEHARTLERWRKRFVDHGVKGLYDETSPGRPPKLSTEQFQAAAIDVQQSPYVFGFDAELWQGKYLREHLLRRYQVDISLRQCQRLLKKLRQQRQPSMVVPPARIPERPKGTRVHEELDAA